MKAYATFPRHITDQSQRQKHKGFMSLSRFLRRAMIVRALRNEREFRSGQPGRFILLVPPGFEPKTLVSAARLALSECAADLQESYDYDVDPVDAETSPLWLEDLPVRLMEMPRYLLLTQSLDFIPHRCRLGFDAVLQMQPPTPAHWRAALKVCLGLAATNVEIDRISRLPIDLVALATGRRRSVSEIIEEVEAAIAEDGTKENRLKQPDASSRQPRSMTLQELLAMDLRKHGASTSRLTWLHGKPESSPGQMSIVASFCVDLPGRAKRLLQRHCRRVARRISSRRPLHGGKRRGIWAIF
ncbi:hypothetical protein GCM10007908_05320 [Rhizobium albus]|nr:hypothetical protein GCM10007908_05320 [Rhizobium albus]